MALNCVPTATGLISLSRLSYVAIFEPFVIFDKKVEKFGIIFNRVNSSVGVQFISQGECYLFYSIDIYFIFHHAYTY